MAWADAVFVPPWTPQRHGLADGGGDAGALDGCRSARTEVGLRPRIATLSRACRTLSGVGWSPVVDSSEWDIEFYADERGSEPCLEWMRGLSRQKRVALETAIELVLARRGLDVVETEFGKALGGGLYEFRLRWPAEEVASKVGAVLAEPAAETEAILLRLFFCTSGRKIILLLSGYDKAKSPGDRRQGKEITKARKLLTAHLETEKRAKAVQRHRLRGR
jgi:hypothetical protein